MIRASFSRLGGRLCSARVCGHAMYAPHGRDIVCASVSSAVQLTANGITEILGEDAGVALGEDTIEIELPASASKQASDFLAALHLHLELIAKQYPNHITITVLEV